MSALAFLIFSANVAHISGAFFASSRQGARLAADLARPEPAAASAARGLVEAFQITGHADDPILKEGDAAMAARPEHAKMELAAAIRIVKPPPSVEQMLEPGPGLRGAQDPEAVRNATDIMNKLIEGAQARLDNKILQCREFDEHSVEFERLAKADLNQLGQGISAAVERIGTATSILSKIETQTQAAQDRIVRLRLEHNRSRMADEHQRLLEVDDFDAASTVLPRTKCRQSLLLSGLHDRSARFMSLRVCNVSGAQQLTLDGALQSQLQSLQSLQFGPEGQQLLRETVLALGPGTDGLEEDGETSAAIESKCVRATPDCGSLHRAFAALCGELKVRIAELGAKMAKEGDELKAAEDAENEALASLSAERYEQEGVLADAKWDNETLTAEQIKRTMEWTLLEAQRTNAVAECRATVHDIVFSEMVALRTIRNEVLTRLPDYDINKFADCEVSDFVTEPCSVACDDSLKGGTQRFTREVITPPSPLGTSCPALALSRACNKVGCPVDCKLSEWTPWSHCSRDCGGGVQSRRRSRETAPMRGGKACGVLQESRACSTASCDKDCELSAWSNWTSCDKACNKGYSLRFKQVVAPAKGSGTCPEERSTDRFENRTCNAQDCRNDEVCGSKLDLVVAIDVGGSTSQKGFDVLKSLAAQLIQRLRPDAKAGVVQFGDGSLDANAWVTDAELVAPLGGEMEARVQATLALQWKPGFTNMAQAMMKAESTLLGAERRSAERVVVLLTTSRPAFKLQLEAAAQDLRKMARLIVVEVFPPEDGSSKFLRSIVSEPHQVNLVSIPGKAELGSNLERYVGELLAIACPQAASPSQDLQKEKGA
mmetsp:Transcript_40152/g.87724  ORF Transcript_40152/g.87724 Transcript_40152/m.87724 type:complete len:831 (-) Transcript_40152:52-2544(-)